MSEAACQWRQTDDEHTPDTWQADCGAMWTFTDGGPKDNDMNFCPNCGKPLSQIDNAMTNKKDPYASEAETQALLASDTRTAAERKLAQMMVERGVDEQGAEAYPILWEIAVNLLDEGVATVCCGDFAACLQPCTPRGEWLAKQSAPEQKRPPNCGTGYCSCIECVMKPAQPTPTKCRKCGDADPAFTDVCQAPACGMREAP